MITVMMSSHLSSAGLLGCNLLLLMLGVPVIAALRTLERPEFLLDLFKNENHEHLFTVQNVQDKLRQLFIWKSSTIANVSI